MEKGNAAAFKNKTLEEIDVDMNEIDAVLGDDVNLEIFNLTTDLSKFFLFRI